MKGHHEVIDARFKYTMSLLLFHGSESSILQSVRILLGFLRGRTHLIRVNYVFVRLRLNYCCHELLMFALFDTRILFII